MFNLITSYYKPQNEQRQTELNNCLINNAKNPNIKTIYLLNSEIYNIDFVEDAYKCKIVQFLVNDENKERLHYNFAIQFINYNLVDEKCILSNSDIYFDETLELIETFDFTNNAFALSRHDNGVLVSDAVCSQDSWVFKSPLNVDISNLNFMFGVPVCDNIFSGFMVVHGYKVYNPSLSIKSYHLHESNYRTYSEDVRIHGLYLNISASSLETLHLTELQFYYK